MEAQQQLLIRGIFLLISKVSVLLVIFSLWYLADFQVFGIFQRPEAVCNFMSGDQLSGEWGKGTKLIYRHYATLFFVFACEETESELGILDLIQVSVNHSVAFIK